MRTEFVRCDGWQKKNMISWKQLSRAVFSGTRTLTATGKDKINHKLLHYLRALIWNVKMTRIANNPNILRPIFIGSVVTKFSDCDPISPSNHRTCKNGHLAWNDRKCTNARLPALGGQFFFCFFFVFFFFFFLNCHEKTNLFKTGQQAVGMTLFKSFLQACSKISLYAWKGSPKHWKLEWFFFFFLNFFITSFFFFFFFWGGHFCNFSRCFVPFWAIRAL